MRSAVLIVGLTGCHLIGGAGDLEYHDAPAVAEEPGAGGSGAGAIAVGGGDGGFTPTCSATACDGACQACEGDACVPHEAGVSCAGGVCDGGGTCFETPSPTASIFGAAGSYQQAYGAVAVEGDVVIVGSTGGSFAFGGASVAGSASGDAFAVRVGGGGEALWARSWGDGAWFQAATSVATLPGHVIVAGHYQGSLAGLPSTLGGFDGFVVAVGADDGLDAWDLALQGSGDQLLEGLAAAGEVVAVAGLTTGAMSVGGSSLEAAGTEPFVTVLDAAGAPRWSKTLDGTGDGAAVATDGSTVLFAGHHDGASSGDGTALGAAGAFVVGYDADGAEIFAVGWPGARVEAVTFAASPLVAGRFTGSQPWGDRVEADGVGDLWAAALDDVGVARWSATVRVEGAEAVVEAACSDPEGRVFLAGSLGAGGRLEGPTGGWLEAVDEDAFVVVLSEEGGLLWATVSATPGIDRVASLTPRSDRTVAAGWAAGPIFGAATAPSDLDGWWATF